MKLPFVSRAYHDAVVAGLVAEHGQTLMRMNDLAAEVSRWREESYRARNELLLANQGARESLVGATSALAESTKMSKLAASVMFGAEVEGEVGSAPTVGESDRAAAVRLRERKSQ